MIVNTHTEKVVQVRKTVLELLLAYGDHNCLLCEQTGNCELQDLVYEHGIDQFRIKSEFKPWPKDESNSMITRDQNKCVLCGRCVRGCLEVQVNGVIDVAARGSDSYHHHLQPLDAQGLQLRFLRRVRECLPHRGVDLQTGPFQGASRGRSARR